MADKYRRLKASVMAIILSTSFAVTSSCSNDKKEADDIGIEVIDDDYDDLYTYILDTDYVKHLGLQKIYNEGKTILRVTSEKRFGNNEINWDYFYNKANFSWPNCYLHYFYGVDNSFYDSFLSRKNVDCVVYIKKLSSYQGSEFTLCTTKLTMKKDIIDEDGRQLEGIRYLKQGDELTTRCLYYDDKLIALTQTGVGSDCSNIKCVGNLDKALVDVDTEVNKKVALDKEHTLAFIENINNTSVKQKRKTK